MTDAETETETDPVSETSAPRSRFRWVRPLLFLVLGGVVIYECKMLYGVISEDPETVEQLQYTQPVTDLEKARQLSLRSRFPTPLPVPSPPERGPEKIPEWTRFDIDIPGTPNADQSEVVIPEDVEPELATLIVDAQQFEGVKLTERKPLEPHWQQPTRLALSRDGSRIAILYHDGFAQVWDLHSRKKLHEALPFRKPDWHKPSPFAISPDGTLLARRGRFNDHFEVHRVGETEPLMRSKTDSRASAFAFSEDHRFLLMTDGNHRLRRVPLDGTDVITSPMTSRNPAHSEIVRTPLPSIGFAIGVRDTDIGLVPGLPNEAGQMQPRSRFLKTRRWESPRVGVTLGNRTMLFGRGVRTNLDFIEESEPSNPRFSIRNYTSHLDHAMASAMLNDGRTALAANRRGLLEFVPADLPDTRFLTAIPPEQLRVQTEREMPVVAISEDGTTLVRAGSRRIRIWTIERTPFAGLSRFLRHAISLLERNDFDEYDRLYDVVAAADYRIPHSELIDLRSALVKIGAWYTTSEQKAIWSGRHPDSIVVRCANAANLISDGWDARGSGMAFGVREEDWETFHQKLEQAGEELIKIPFEKAPRSYYHSLAKIGQGLNWPDSMMQGLIEKLMASPYRADPETHFVIASNMLPRWGGEPGMARDYLIDVRDTIGGEEGIRCFLDAVVSLSCFFNRSGYLERNGFEPDEITEQIDRLAALSSPTDPDVLAARLHLARFTSRKALTPEHYADFDAGGAPFDAENWKNQLTWWHYVNRSREQADPHRVVLSMPLKK